MNLNDSAAPDGDSISYEGSPVAEVEVEGIEYRVDAGLGSIVAISRRDVGASAWLPIAQGRWDGVRLKAKSLEHPVVASLERALAQARAAADGGEAWR